MATEDKKNSVKLAKNKPTQEQIVAGFNQLRQEQRSLATKLSELEMELNEHTLVVDTLKDVDGDRKCFRMIGGVLVERTVKDVLPALLKNKEQLGKAIASYTQKISSKGEEINQYREKYNIRIRGQDDVGSMPSQAGEGSALDDKPSDPSTGGSSTSGQSVLVS